MSMSAGTTEATVSKDSSTAMRMDATVPCVLSGNGNEATSEKGLALGIHRSLPIRLTAASTTTCPLNRCHVNHVVDGAPSHNETHQF